MSKKDLLDLIAQGERRLEPKEHRLWTRLKINPQKWSAGEYGESTGGFWAVGIIGDQVLWYNEIEEGFGFTRYTKFGQIDEFHYEQDELKIPILRLARFLNEGAPE